MASFNYEIANILLHYRHLPHAIHITMANITDREGAVLMTGKAKDNLSEVKRILGDGGYCGRNFAVQIDTLIGAEELEQRFVAELNEYKPENLQTKRDG
jgi:uncharacterized heparinase superfamily protein